MPPKKTSKKSKAPIRAPVNREYLEIVPKLSSLGFVVLPLDDKRPILKGWNKIEKTPERLYVFENRNLGIITGRLSGVTILDIDLKDGGMELWINISSAYPDIITPIVQTASGGIHIYFKYNKKLHSFSRFTLKGQRVGWDLLNNDRQAVVPPSVNPITKKAYTWIATPEEVPFAHMPQWLEEYLLMCKSFK